jgi:DNA-binding response OmpR family regulator
MSIQARILLVDDESALEKALANIKTEAPELIVSDVLMPKMDGRELHRSLCQDDKLILMILLTQVGEAFERVIAPDVGVDDVIINPSNPTNWLLESGSFYGGQDQENHHSQQPGRLRMVI